MPSEAAPKRARELVAEWESHVDRLSPSQFDNTDRERGRAEAYASCARELRELLLALDAWAEEARRDEARAWRQHQGDWDWENKRLAELEAK